MTSIRASGSCRLYHYDGGLHEFYKNDRNYPPTLKEEVDSNMRMIEN
jgi:hypothetical protein